MDGLRRLLHGERDARAPRSCSLQVVGFDKECAFGEARKLASCRLQVGAPSPCRVQVGAPPQPSFAAEGRMLARPGAPTMVLWLFASLGG